jgi:methionyl aminopeptidase
MRTACRAAAETLRYVGNLIKPGMTTADIDRLVHNDTVRRAGIPATLNYKGFPASCCTSVNDVVCHGIPGPYVLKEGDIVNVDVTTVLDGHYGDTNATFLVGEVDEEVKELVNRTAEAMWRGIHVVKPGAMLGEIGHAIQAYVEAFGYGVVREFGGHGIGTRFHLPPHVNHFGRGTEGPRLVPGMLFTVEPMVTLGQAAIYLEDDGWTVRTHDGLPSAQYEHTVLVTETGYEVLTLAKEGM